MTRSWGAGLGALAKSLLLLFGAPAAILRLLVAAAPLGTHGLPAAGTRVLLGVATLAWAVASARLLTDVVRALRGDAARDAAWSRRWATALAGLLLAASAGPLAWRSGPPSPPLRPPAPVAPRTARGTRAPRPLGDAAPGGARETAPPGLPAAPSPLGTPAPLVAAVALVGLSSLGALALARRLAVLRRLAECLRRPGERPPPPDARTAWAEALLGPLADEERLEWIDAANRLLWRSLRDAGAAGPLPAVTLVRAGRDGVELLLDSPRAATDGFVAADGGRRWVLDPGLRLDEVQALGAGCGRFLPALVPLGDDGASSYLVPLGPGRRLVIEGDPEECRRVLAAVLVALRTLPWAEETGVELVGIAPPPAAERSYQLSPSSYAELADLAARAAAPAPDERLRASFTPAVVVVVGGSAPLDEEVLGSVGAHAGVVSLGGQGSDHLVLDEKGALLEPLGLSLAPARPTPEQLRLVDDLLAAAAAPAAPVPAGTPGDADEPGALPRAPGPVEIRLLAGEAHLAGDGVQAVPDAARAVEVCAYVALHGGAVDLEELRHTVFRRADGGTAAPSRVANVCSAARRALGRGPAGHPYLPAATAGRLRLDAAVTLDAQRFWRLALAARRLPAADALDALVQALGLVGPGRLVLPRWAWFAAEGRARALIAAVVDAAHHCAQLALAAGDLARARWAVEQGRLAEPASELLTRDLLAACADGGDLPGAHAAYVALEGALEGLAGAEPSSATRALHATLTAAPPSAGTGGGDGKRRPLGG